MDRWVIVGDVHGCSAELDDLLDRVGISAGDGLAFVGDLVAKGPRSREVMKRARELGAQVALGNHEERMLDAHRARLAGRPPQKLDKTHVALLEELDDEEWSMLEALPLWLDLEAGLRVVHAGLVPGIPMAEQDPYHLTHLRSISDAGEPSSKFGPPWGARYRGPPHVVFGHNARKDPQLHPDATGLDTGCVYGGRLTALVIPKGTEPPAPDVRADALVSVPAREAYSDYGGPLQNR
jgi:hypothetical protein